MPLRPVILAFILLALSTAVFGRIALMQCRNASTMATYAESLERSNTTLRGGSWPCLLSWPIVHCRASAPIWRCRVLAPALAYRPLLALMRSSSRFL